ncbi:hypothetical protein QBC38DRAFT_515632, partial [Podospora fimiseda]
FSLSLLTPGILKSSLLPSFSIQFPLSLITYFISRSTNKLEIKDLSRPLGPLLNAWYSAVLRHVFTSSAPISFLTAVAALSGAEKLLLGGVTIWAGRLFWRLTTRAVKRRESPMYETMKNTWGFSWNKVFWSVFLPEGILQGLIGVPLGLGFRVGCPYTELGGMEGMGVGQTKWRGWLQGLSVGLYTAGMVLEGLGDWQLEGFKKGEVDRRERICKEGVWGIVRHPNYLGDALVHLSFTLLLYASDMLAPIALVGPVANYIFLRYVGGDKKDEYSRTRRYSSADVSKKVEFDRYKREINSFWPDISQAYNPWTWIVVGCGVAGGLFHRIVIGVL